MTRFSLNNPAAMAVVATLIILFGLMAMRSLPIQLLPDVEQSTISIQNFWRAAAPEEVEESIIQPQEEVLRNIQGMESMVSSVSRGSGRIDLNFRVGWDMQRALIDVISQLNQADDLPADAEEPRVQAGGQERGQAASLLIYTLPGNDVEDVAVYQQLFDREVEPVLARLPGVGRVDMAGEREKEVSITLKAEQMAARNITLNEVSTALRRAVDVSGGFADVGRRRYTVRFMGQRAIPDLDNLVVAWRSGEPVRLGTIADVEVKLKKRQVISFRNGFPAYYISIVPSFDANTVELLDALNPAIDKLNQDVLNAEGLQLELSFDASLHIRRAINLVQGNLLLGLLLASITLWFFLRNARSTLLIAAMIPLCLLVAFISLRLTGKTLNVISLAGLAFAVGLVMDAAIVVQENILRLRDTGMEMFEAALTGCKQVSGALFSSTLTSVAIFVPILFMEGAEGQLFKDLAITLAVTVSMSLLAALVLLPTATVHWLKKDNSADPYAERWDKVADIVTRATDKPAQRWAWTGGILGVSAIAFMLLTPKVDFLPKARIDAVQTYFSTPPGINLETLHREIMTEIIERMKPYYNGEKEPHIRGYNLSSFNAADTFAFFYPKDPESVPDILNLFRTELFSGLDDTQAFVQQSSMLRMNGNNGPDGVFIDLQGSDLEKLADAATTGMDSIRELWGTRGVVFATPDISKGAAELKVTPDDQRLHLAGMSRSDLASTVRAYTDGLFAGEYFDGNERYDVLLHGPEWRSPEQLAALPLATPSAGIQTIGELATIHRAIGPDQLQRVDGQRTITLTLIPPDDVTMEEALLTLQTEVEPKIEPLLPDGARISYRGSANRLSEALDTVAINFGLAIFILFLIMTAMFKSVRDSLLVLLVMPMAVAGGLLGLKLLNLITYQSLDLLTMIGFIILLGLVVNNAILLVDQTRSAQREGASHRDAVAQAVRYRARPIFMSTLTSLLGMLPLMVVPGVGSEIYRGLATVIVGGMSICALLTLFLLPSLLRLGEKPAVIPGEK
jgi:multidrug efflux pump subunit AcrB